MTDADGKFTVPVHFEIDSDRRESPLWYYTYNIQADVTDGAGETQQANLSLPLGSTSMVLNMDNLPDNLVKEKKLEIVQKRIHNLISNLSNCSLNSTQVSNNDLRMLIDNFFNGGQATTLGTVMPE